MTIPRVPYLSSHEGMSAAEQVARRALSEELAAQGHKGAKATMDFIGLFYAVGEHVYEVPSIKMWESSTDKDDTIDTLEVDPRGIYIASKTKHAAEWRAFRAEGYPIVASWIDVAEGVEVDYVTFWCTNIAEASGARAFVLYAEEGETAKGSLVELGAALACGVPVFYVGPADMLTALRHERVFHCATVADALHRAVEET